jgi:hypothetical protein
MQVQGIKQSSSLYAVAALVAAVSVLIFLACHPDVLHGFSVNVLGTAVGDGGLYVWLTQSFMSDPSSALRFETNGMYPYPLTRAWSDSYLLPSALVLLFVSLGVSFVAAYNAVLVLALGANAGAVYVLARRLRLEHLFAVAAALVFGNSSYIVANIGHPQLLFFFWVPLAWSLVLPEVGVRRAAARQWLLAGVCVTAAFYSAVYYAIFAVIGFGIVWLREFLSGVSSPRRSLRTALLALLGAFPIAYGMPAYLAVQGYFGARGLYEAEAFAASGLSYLSFSSFHSIYSFTSQWSHGEGWLGAGFCALVLVCVSGARWALACSRIVGLALLSALAVLVVSSSTVDASTTTETLIGISAWGVLLTAIVLTWRMDRAWGALVLICAVFFVFSFGPGGNPEKGEPAFAPLGVIYERLPGVSSIRAVGRFGIVVILGVLLGAARVVQRMLAGKDNRHRGVVKIVSAAVLCGVGLLENSVSFIPFMPLPKAPVAVEEVAQEAEGGVVSIVLPFGGARNEERVQSLSELAILNTQYTLWSSAPGSVFPVLNGYSGQRSKLQKELPDVTSGFPDARSLDYLARICGVRSVLVVPQLSAEWDAATFDRALNEWAASLSKVTRSSDGSMRIDLADRPLRVTPGSPVTFFAPRSHPTRLEVTAVSSESCDVTIESLGKQRDGNVEPIRNERFLVSRRQEIRVVPPAGLSAASPHVVRIGATGCEVQVVCEPR